MDKMPYYEPPYPEETHYSHIFRLSKLNGFDSVLDFAKQYLIANGMFVRGINLQESVTNMASFFASSGITTPYSDYVLDTTAYAYHAMFLNDYRNRKYINRLYQIDNRFSYVVHMDKPDICYCPDCMEDKAYFRRIHQIPNVNVCPIHGKVLYKYTGATYHELDMPIQGELVDCMMPYEDEYKIAAFIYDCIRSGLTLSLNDYRNVIYSKIGDYLNYDALAAEYMKTGLSSLFKDQTSIINFLKAGIRQGKVPEGEAVGMLVFLFGDFNSFSEYYEHHKAEYTLNNIDESDFIDFMNTEGYSLVSAFRPDIITVRHDYCNKMFITTPSMLMDGWLCPHCSRNMDDAAFQSRIVDYTGQGEYSFISPASSISDRITIHHSRCNKDISPTLDDFLFRGYKCSCNNKLIASDVQALLDDKGEFDLIGYKSSHEPIEVKCKKCGNVHTFKDISYVRKLTSCHICNPVQTKNKQIDAKRTIKRVNSDGTTMYYKNDINHARNVIYNLVGDEYSVLDFKRMDNGKYSVLVRHAECGEESWITYYNFMHGSRCQCEGHAVQASDDELKRYIHDLSNGQYICCDTGAINRNNVHIKSTITGEVHSLSYKMALQEISRITPSSILPCDNVNRNAIRPRSAPMLFMEYLRNTYSEDGVFFLRDIYKYEASRPWIGSTLNMLLGQGLLKRVGAEVYMFPDTTLDWNKIARLFYIEQNGVRYGCTYGRSFLQGSWNSCEASSRTSTYHE